MKKKPQRQYFFLSPDLKERTSPAVRASAVSKDQFGGKPLSDKGNRHIAAPAFPKAQFTLNSIDTMHRQMP